MSRTITLKSGIALNVELRPFASGGEGDLFKITSPQGFKNRVLKVYRPEKRTKERQAKIEYLKNNTPNIQSKEGHNSIIWIEDIAYENGNFIGFTMHMAVGIKLELLCHKKLPPQLTSEWKKFDFTNSDSLGLRLKICYNIAVALYHIHRMSCYVLVDMKPENIMIQSNGLISLIDIDSVAVVKNGNLLYHPPVVTPEYSPPEHYKQQGIFKETWDRFSLAVIFYRLLCGIHPFTGSCSAPYDKCNGLSDMVQNGLFPFGSKKSNFNVIPQPHNTFNKLDKKTQNYFVQCFDGGHYNPDMRPSAEDWCKNLSNSTPIPAGRILPSKVIPFPKYDCSKPLIYNPNCVASFPAINYQSIKPVNSFKTFLGSIFGKSQSQRLREDFFKIQGIIKQKIQLKGKFELELQAIVKEFSNKQQAILNNEVLDIIKLEEEFAKGIAEIDKKAIGMFQLESNETNQLALAYQGSISITDTKIEQLKQEILIPKYRLFEQQKSNIEGKINNYLAQQRNEISNSINDPFKLKKYRIDTYASQIFSSYNTEFISNLNRMGFETLADFTNVSNGLLKSRNGSWLKVPGVATVRANCLNDFKLKIEKKENQLLTTKIENKYAGTISLLKALLSKHENDFKMSILQCQNEFEMKKARFEAEKHNISKKFHEDLNRIKFKYNKLHDPVMKEAKDYSDSFAHKVNRISASIGKQVSSNYESSVIQFTQKRTEINAFIQDIVEQNAELSRLSNEISALITS